MALVAAPICLRCKHKHKGKLTCEAFPAGIPETILMGKHDHSALSYYGDGGIRFEPLHSRVRQAQLEPAR